MAIIRYTLAAVLALAFSLGLGIGYKLGANKLDKALLEAHENNNEMAKKYAQSSAKYYDLYQTELNREPVTITERVFVKATCPSVSSDTDRELGESGGTETRAELHAETVRRITEVTHTAEQDVIKCRIALKSLINKVEK